jgi:hypothetical protein
MNTNNIGGSAVARDLERILRSNHEFKVITKGKFVKIRLDKNFDLHVYAT